MGKNSVYNGEVIGFTAGKMFSEYFDMINVHFNTQEEAETWCESMSNEKVIYVPIKLTSVANKHVKEHSYD